MDTLPDYYVVTSDLLMQLHGKLYKAKLKEGKENGESGGAEKSQSKQDRARTEKS